MCTNTKNRFKKTDKDFRPSDNVLIRELLLIPIVTTAEIGKKHYLRMYK